MQFYEILSQCENPNKIKYQFWSDRFRAIEQDFTVIGNYWEEMREWLKIMIHFYINMGFTFKESKDFEHKFNFQRLTNWLANLFQWYKNSKDSDFSKYLSYLIVINSEDPLSLAEIFHFQSYEEIKPWMKVVRSLNYNFYQFWRYINTLEKNSNLRKLYFIIPRFSINQRIEKYLWVSNEYLSEIILLFCLSHFRLLK